jgi:site-specific recombinase XerD
MAVNLPVPVEPAERASAELVPYSPAFEEAAASAAAFAGESRAPNTLRAYKASFAAFTAWCEASGIADPFPASAKAVAAYVSHLAGSGRKAATIDLHVAAIALAHRSAGYDTPTTTEAVRATLKGIRRRIGTKPTRKAPATADALKKMVKKIPESLPGKRDRAVLLLGFAGAFRRSELVALRVSDLERTPEGLLVHIVRSKTDQAGAGHTIAIPVGSKLKPIGALDAWLSAARITEGPLFRAIDKGGRVSPYALTAQSVALIVKDHAEAAGLNPKLFSGHSLRAGFVTSALASGADLLKITHVTRHTKLETLAAYDRRAQAFKDHAGKGFL